MAYYKHTLKYSVLAILLTMTSLIHGKDVDRDRVVLKECLTLKCIDVLGGDTLVTVDSTGDTLLVTFWGVDCPEPDQYYGKQAALHVQKVCKNRRIKISIKDTLDTTIVSSIVLVETKSKNGGYGYINRTIIRSGSGHWDSIHVPNSTVFEEAYKAAQKEKIGLWHLNLLKMSPYKPWEWRQLSMQDKKVRIDSVREIIGGF